MDVWLSFISLILLSAGLGIDNGLLIEFSLKTLNLEQSKHLFWRSVTLLLASLMRIVFLFSLAKFTFLEGPLPESVWFVNRWFSRHPDDLTWMELVFFVGGLVIFAMAIWEYYHKLREEMRGPERATQRPSSGTFKVVMVVTYLMGMNVLFSLDSVFAAIAIMDLETQLGWMVAATLITAVVMVFGMIPISAIISRNKHFGVLMLSVLAVIATKLLVDGTGAHFSNGLLIFIIGVLLLNDVGQMMMDRAAKNRSPKH